MPELPEVETVIRSLNSSHIIGKTIQKVEILNSKHLKEVDSINFCSLLENSSFQKIKRKGKWIFIFLSKEWVLINHLRMSGKWSFSLLENLKPSLIFVFFGGEKLYFYDSRGFATFHLQKVADFPFSLPYRRIGPDVINDRKKITIQYLKERFKALKIPIKVALLEQNIMSGIGNIYASEILYWAKINPLKPSYLISEDEIGKIIFFSEKILLDSIAKKGTSIVDFLSPEGKGGYQNELKVYARQGQKCQYYCGGFIISSFLNKRNTFYCPSCQT